MMRYVRTIDKTTEVATPRGVTPCSSDLAVEERMENAFTFTLKFLPVGRISRTVPSNFKFSWFKTTKHVVTPLIAELPVVAYNSSFPVGMPCIRTDSFTCSIDIVSDYRLVLKKRILSGIAIAMFVTGLAFMRGCRWNLFPAIKRPVSRHKAHGFSAKHNL